MDFLRIASLDFHTQPLVVSEHYQLLTLLAVLLAIFAASLILPVSRQFKAVRQPSRYLWLLTGAAAIGAGIWAMHFIGLLAYQLPFPVLYELKQILLSVAPMIAASGVLIVLFATELPAAWYLHLSALSLVSGIGITHHLGMEAVIGSAQIHYSTGPSAVSFMAAYMLAWGGLTGGVALAGQRKLPPFVTRLGLGLLLGLIVSAIHFAVLSATYLVSDSILTDSQSSALPMGQLAGMVGMTVFPLVLLAIAATLSRRIDTMTALLKQSEDHFRQLADTTKTAIFTIVGDRITYANPALEKIIGLNKEALPLVSVRDLFGWQFAEYAGSVANTESPPGHASHESFEIETAQGDKRWLYFSLTVAEVDHRSTLLVSAFDISAQKDAELKVRRLAHSDQLTALASRALFMERLGDHLTVLGRAESDVLSMLVLLDLDNFKLINDTYGHTQGDQLLMSAAERIRTLTRKSDTVARLGGDEFVMLFEELESINHVEVIAERIINTLAQPYIFNGKKIDMKASMGMVVLNASHHSAPDEVLHDADVALIRAKRQGGASWVIFDQQMDATIKRGRQLQSELKKAIAERQLQLFYQPIYSTDGYQLCGFESLARWQRENGEWVSPTEFIPLAEEAGLIADIGLWCIETACEQIGRWNARQPGSDYYVSVNIASDSFGDERFATCIEISSESHRVRRGQLKLELTERILLANTDNMLEKLHKLIGLGCELLIDDFGTGYSSLSYLHLLPVATLKIDRSFVINLEQSNSSMSVVKTIIALAKSLDMSIVAEGVETRAQADLLSDLGVNQLQGYYFGRPVAAGEAEAFFVAAEVAAPAR